jgi:transcriptional regulator with XRE-family HTH domain
MTVGESIRKARESRSYSRRQVSIKTRIPYATLVSWERNISNPTIELLTILADSYDMTIDELIGRKKKDGVEQSRKS